MPPMLALSYLASHVLELEAWTTKRSKIPYEGFACGHENKGTEYYVWVREEKQKQQSWNKSRESEVEMTMRKGF